MKKYLIRGGADPTKRYTPGELLKKDSIGNNSGNLMFLYGTMNVLTTSNAVCVPTYYQSEWSAAEIDEINQNYSAFVMPLADGFRASFTWNLDRLTDLMKQLKIPCIVNGVGLRAKYDPDPDFSFPFNDTVKRFVGEVLNHSSMLGLRGEITGDYLKKLGFLPERDYTVIGCPSMYMHGSLKENGRPENGSVGLSLNGLVPERLEQFYIDLITTNENAHIIQQRSEELIDLYYGVERDLSTKVPEFSQNNIFEAFDFRAMKADGRVTFFTDVPDWIHYLRSFSLFVGARFHGTVAAVLAGVPTVITPFDARTRELAAYHHIPTITERDLQQGSGKKSPWEVADFDQVVKAQEKNLSHYKDFLKCNGLPSVFDEQTDLSFGRSPMENQAFNKWKPSAPISAYEACALPERAARKAEYVLIKGAKRIRRLIIK
ncbi:MAG: polysaccharide pyruvyl transferase family protein [Oscillospiraceae bacterium]|nr:polysaccharide pyruvyl transferase family protein [Oscillospiraceae bacterium]